MKKLLYCIPALLFTAAYLLMAVYGFGVISLRQVIWLALFLLAGILLGRGKFWGGAFGLIPAVEFMCMSARSTGQVIDIEFPLGAALGGYYIVCSIAAYRKQREG